MILMNCNIGSLEPVFFRCWTYFIFYILLIWGVRTHPTHPPPCLRAWTHVHDSTALSSKCEQCHVSRGIGLRG